MEMMAVENGFSNNKNNNITLISTMGKDVKKNETQNRSISFY